MTTAPANVVKELAPTGRLQAALNLGNMILVQTDPKSGEHKGVTVDLARELGRRLGVPVDFHPYDAAGKTFEAFKSGGLDIIFLAIEPVRAAEIEFTAPYVIIEGVYMVPKESKLKNVADVDAPDVRIAVNKASAYDLFLTRSLKHATLVRSDSGGLDTFRDQKLEAVGGIKQPLAAYAAKNADVRVIDGRFMEIRQAMGTQKGRPAAAAYLRAFVEEMKASGFVADALKRSNQLDAAVAPAA